MRIGVGALLSTMLACSSVVMVSCQTAPPAPEKLKVVDGMKITLEYTIALPDHTIAASNVGQKPLSGKDLVFDVTVLKVEQP